MTSEIQSN